jgi:hypothetical protein
MARQSLVWTALPNGLTENRDGLRLSVTVTPRLDPDGDDPRVASFAPDWVDWPATLATATVHVHYGGPDAVSVPLSERSAANRLDETLGAPDSAAWQALVRPDLFVRQGPFKDHTGTTVLSYATTEVEKLVAGLYGALGAATDGHLPTVSGLLGTPGWDTLVGAVEQLDERWTDRRTGQRAIRRQFEAYRRGADDVAPLTRLLGHAQLFHTPPSTPIATTRTRTDDTRISTTTQEFVQTALPAPESFAELLDFHQVLGAMSSYPTVLRRLGIVVDLVLAREAFPDTLDEALWVTVSFDGDGLQVPRDPDVSPVTHAELSDAGFAAVSDPAADMRVPGRLLDLGERFELLEVDVDGAALKLMNFARSIGRHARDDERVDTVTRREKQLGAPALRTAGLMLVHNDRRTMLQDRFAANAAKHLAAQDVFDGKAGAAAPELFAEDLLRGWRFDIWDAATRVWRSLGRREATYWLGEDGLVIEPVSGEEEGTVRLAATRSPDPASNPDVLWLHEAVVSWTGWSLAAPPPGRAIGPDDSVGAEAQTEAELPPGLHFRSRYRAAKGSLPRLRFGRSYWIRARAVDLAGNSLAPQETDFGPEQPELHARAFLRYEPIAAPVTALVKREDDTTEIPAEGESMHRLAIRSFNDVPADNDVPSPQIARRFAVPQQVTARDAEQHGMLDIAGAVDPTTFGLLANEKDRDAHDPQASLIEEVLPLAGPLDAAPADHTFAVYRDGRELTYLPDPLAEEIAVRIFGVASVDPDSILTIGLYPGSVWPDARPFKVELVEAPGTVPAYDEATRPLRVPLGTAVRATVRLSVKPSARALLEIMGVWRWIAGGGELERLALDGQHWMLTPWTTLELVHAVQRPLLAPEFEKLRIDRSLGDTSAQPRFSARCSIKSSDRLDVLAEWHEPIDDPAADAATDQQRGDVAFSVKITGADDYARKDLGNPRGGIADHDIAGPDLIEVGVEPGHFRPPLKHHEFHDTRYRRIEYHLEATSRFREYLPAALLVDDDGTGPKPSEQHITVVGPPRITWIPSSAPPPAPDVLYVVPTFGWERGRGDGGTSSWRRGGGLRVYLDRPWNVSGYGEMLAVVLAPAGFTGDPETQPKGKPYAKYVTQWGNDPIWSSRSVAGIAPSRASFPLARTSPDAAGHWLPASAPASEADQPPGPFQVTNLGAYDAPLEIAPHDVFYDAERKLWYCDIEIDQGAAYWPFIRLALARYQPVSVSGAMLSEIVLADFMPLVADRWLNVTHGEDARSRRVTVSGWSHDDSSGHTETADDDLFISPTSVIEVSVERLDPARGEDFGWERTDARVVAHGAAGPVGAGPWHVAFTPAHRIARGRELLSERRFAELVSEDLVGVLLGLLTLWDGVVTLPADPGDGDRYRLVIAEYEEYPVDDSRPYDPPVRAKSRRLVFVEHIELS